MERIIKPISVVLKEARRNKGVTLDEAYKATKIHPKILHALEEGTTLQLSGVYVKSYIKIYAKYLGISQKELDRYLGAAAATKEKEEKKISPDMIFKVNKDKIQHLLKMPPELSSQLGSKIKNLKYIIIVFVVLWALFVFGKYIFRARKMVPALPAKAAKAKVGAISKSYPKQVESKQKVAKKETPQRIEDSLRLTIFAEEDTWLQIKLDGNVVFKGILKKLNSETWQAKNRIELQTNNAGTIRLEFNNKALPRIGRRGQPLRSVLFTKEGFSIK